MAGVSTPRGVPAGGGCRSGADPGGGAALAGGGDRAGKGPRPPIGRPGWAGPLAVGVGGTAGGSGAVAWLGTFAAATAAWRATRGPVSAHLRRAAPKSAPGRATPGIGSTARAVVATRIALPVALVAGGAERME